MGLRKVCSRDALMGGEKLAVTAGRRRVLLVDIGGRLCAYEDRCPHKGVPLSDGALSAATLTCAAHHWTFDAMLGRGVNPEGTVLVPVPYVLADGAVWIDDHGERERPRAGNGAVSGNGGDRGCEQRPTPALTPLPPSSSEERCAVSYPQVKPVRAPGPESAAHAPAAGYVGPVLLAGAVTDAVVASILERHAHARIVDQGSYLRVFVPWRCVIRADDVGSRLRKPFRIPTDLEPLMCSFKGVFTASEEEAVFEAVRSTSAARGEREP